MITADQFMSSLRLPEVYRVGGSVRDELLKRPVKDHDYIVRGAGVTRIEGALKDAGATVTSLKLRDGRKIGVRAWIQQHGYMEIVLPRRETSTGPGHRDFDIVIDKDLPLEQDALRRDFTINALYKDVKTGVILDPLAKTQEGGEWGGLYDLECCFIRTTHPDSFRDDPLRILRALRFVSTLLGFDLVESTFQEMKRHASSVTALTLKGVSATALTELEGILMGAQPGSVLRFMRDAGVLQVLLPELASIVGFRQESAYHDKLLDEHTFDAVQAAADFDAPLRVRMALLFHDAGKPWMAWTGEDARKHYYALTVQQIHDRLGGAPPTAVHSHEWWGAWLAGAALERLNAPAELCHDVTTLIERHMLPLEGKVRPIKVRTWRAELDDFMLRDLILHRRCDVLGKGGIVDDPLEALDELEAERWASITGGVPRSRMELKIDGHDLQRLGVHAPEMGMILKRLLYEVMAQPKLNTSEWLLARAGVLARSL